MMMSMRLKQLRQDNEVEMRLKMVISMLIMNVMKVMKVFNKYALFAAVNVEDDITDSEFVDSNYSLEDDHHHAVDDTVIDTVIRDVERGEGVGNQHQEVIDARDVEDIPLDDEIEDSDGLHNFDDLGSECDENVIYPEFNEEIDMDDPKFENGLKFKDVAQLREAVWPHSSAPFIKLKRNEKWKISARCEKNCPLRLYAFRLYNEDSMQVKTYVGKHECPRIWRENPNSKVARLVKRYDAALML
ncbi:hypothetical protein D8674_009772 [Pyrus ussuriensis x Pyrus communis]|uniref:Transposase MuDR plant domain-containing protein n=1 Tax=Pyrus ussuriensis x Pyrus communis TaxID=2448454 RepID=A0A5N5FCC9_9ROSA|nr:hypothetical protein D8674_009772 [Pyrus ussuriensis x Pyrus communis]